jgi:hypothetical protein
MPEKIVYRRFLQMKGDPRLRGDDKESFRHVRVGEHPLEGCTRTSPEPVLSKDEWAGMTKKVRG